MNHSVLYIMRLKTKSMLYIMYHISHLIRVILENFRKYHEYLEGMSIPWANEKRPRWWPDRKWRKWIRWIYIIWHSLIFDDLQPLRQELEVFLLEFYFLRFRTFRLLLLYRQVQSFAHKFDRQMSPRRKSGRSVSSNRPVARRGRVAKSNARTTIQAAAGANLSTTSRRTQIPPTPPARSSVRSASTTREGTPHSNQTVMRSGSSAESMDRLSNVLQDGFDRLGLQMRQTSSATFDQLMERLDALQSHTPHLLPRRLLLILPPQRIPLYLHRFPLVDCYPIQVGPLLHTPLHLLSIFSRDGPGSNILLSTQLEMVNSISTISPSYIRKKMPAIVMWNCRLKASLILSIRPSNRRSWSVKQKCIKPSKILSHSLPLGKSMSPSAQLIGPNVVQV